MRKILPDAPEVFGEGLRAGMRQLFSLAVVRSRWPSKKPQTQPLIWCVRTHAVVRRRSDDPVDLPSERSQSRRSTSVSLDGVAARRVRRTLGKVPLRTSTNDALDIHSARLHSSFSPKSHSVVRFRCVR